MDITKRQFLAGIPAVAAVPIIAASNEGVQVLTVVTRNGRIPKYLQSAKVWILTDKAQSWSEKNNLNGVRVKPEDKQLVLNILMET